MSKPTPRPVPRRGRPRKDQGRDLTLDKIVAAALRITDIEGLDALSMRRLGAELGVDPMAIYRHVPNKDALLQVLVNAVFSRIELKDDPHSPWRDRVCDWIYAYRKLIRSYPTFVREVVANAAAADSATRSVMGPIRSALVDAGLSVALAQSTMNTLVDFVHGYSLAVSVGRPLNEAAPSAAGARDDASAAASAKGAIRSLEESFTTSINIIIEGALALGRKDASALHSGKSPTTKGER